MCETSPARTNLEYQPQNHCYFVFAMMIPYQYTSFLENQIHAQSYYLHLPTAAYFACSLAYKVALITFRKKEKKRKIGKSLFFSGIENLPSLSTLPTETSKGKSKCLFLLLLTVSAVKFLFQELFVTHCYRYFPV